MKLTTRSVEKPWGMDTLPAPFTSPAQSRIGEIWFEPPEALPGLLVKYLFTSDKLSVQVHPDDLQTERAGIGRQGKEECWLVIAAEPGAKLGIGFREAIDAETMREAALDGSIEDLLAWHDVSPGDFFYIPAGTVHAIGAGCSIIEIQQNSDITYRLYDYGRPRELHLEEAVAVAHGAPYPAELKQRGAEKGDRRLVDGPYFRLDRVEGAAPADFAARYSGPLLVIPRRGTALVEGEEVTAGECALAPDFAHVEFDPEGAALVAQPA